MRFLLSISIWLIFTLSTTAQPTSVNKTKTMSSKSLISFTEVWVWEYTDANGLKNEMAIYREPKLNYWLLTSEAYGNSDDMCDWILIKPDGNYYFAYKDAELGGGRTLLKMRLEMPVIKKMPLYWKATGKRKAFGDKSSGFPLFNAVEYLLSYMKTTEKSTFYLAPTKANFASLSRFNDLDTDAKLHIRFPKDIPGHYAVLSEVTKFKHQAISYQFKYISHAVYEIDLLAYELKQE